MPDSRRPLREFMRKQRLQLTPEQQTFASLDIIPRALSLIEHYQSAKLAFYLPFNGEISPLPLMQALRERQKSLYLPVLHPFTPGNLLFLHYADETSLKIHRFGMLQPELDVGRVLPLNELEMIFVPLLACDKRYNRLGYGGGFYDRTLAQAPHAVSVGLAHRCQLVERVPVEPWDIPLDHLIIGNAS